MFLLLSLLACSSPESPEADPVADGSFGVPEPVTWPQYGSFLTPQEVVIPEDFGTMKVYLDAGHGARNNEGNTGVFCQKEQAVTLQTAQALHAALTAHPNFQSTVCRQDDQTPSYSERVDAAAEWGADIFLSIHTDSREGGGVWEFEGQECLRNDTDPGFAILWSSRGPLAERRKRAARALANRLSATGITAYHGEHYGTRYVMDTEVPGVFEDRRQLFVLYKPVMPSLIIETHHALDANEVPRWDEPQTHEAFAAAVIAALVESRD